MLFTRRKIKNSSAAFAIACLGILLLILVWDDAQGPAGGQDSWNHFLYARWALKHPSLMLDQWGKTLFTIPAIPFSYFGMGGMYVMNLACVALGAWMTYMTAARIGIKLPWMAVLFYIFMPVVFGNAISALTEPMNALALSVVFYLLATQKWAAAAILASLLPFFRTEGLVILPGILLYFCIKGKWKYTPLLLVGTAIFTLIGGIFLKNPLWLFKTNPYVAQQVRQYEWGRGTWLHFIRQHGEITGWLISLLLLLALVLLATHTVYIARRRTPEEKSRFCYWLVAPVFLSFLLAHTIVWKFGMMGSNGLTRVFLVVAPAIALLCNYAADKIYGMEIRNLNRVFPGLFAVIIVFLAYWGNRFPVPGSGGTTIEGYPARENLDKVFAFIAKEKLDDRVLVHQMPFINAIRDIDPWMKFPDAKTYYIWSIATKPADDWLPDSSVMIWDGTHAVREGQKPMDTMRMMTNYKELLYVPHSNPDLDLRLFIKVNEKP